MNNERVVLFRPRTIITTAAVLFGLAVCITVLWVARNAITWVLISLFLALALNPAVEWLQRHGLHRRGAATAAVYLLALLVIVGLGALLIPPLVKQVGDLVDAVPGYIDDFTNGRGFLGDLNEKYDISQRVRDAIGSGGGSASGSGGLAGSASTVLDIGRGIATGVAGVVTIIFMTLFMLLEGPAWVERFFSLIDAEKQPRWRDVGHGIYRTIGGYISGNLLISVIAGSATAIVLLILGVPYALALGLVVAVLDLIPLAGATLAAIIVTAVAAFDSTTAAIVVAAFFVVYQQAENHILQPVVYGRTVQLSPLVVLISILIGVELAGILGALGAIPIAGSLQVIVKDWVAHRARKVAVEDGADPGAVSADAASDRIQRGATPARPQPAPR